MNAATDAYVTPDAYIVQTYVAYVLISLALTVWVARTLHKNGRLFLVDVFCGNEPLADSVNHLLVVGFYLINFGFISFALATGRRIDTLRESIELLSGKLGGVLVVLGLMHFFNLFVFSVIRGRAHRRQRMDESRPQPAGPSIPPSAPVAPAGGAWSSASA